MYTYEYLPNSNCISIHTVLQRYGNLIGWKAKRYSCCERKADGPGCVMRWKCCGRVDDGGEGGCGKRFDCCGVDADDEEEEGCELMHLCCGRRQGEPGCEERCVKCGAEWGTAAVGCFRRSHNLVRDWKTEEQLEQERLEREKEIEEERSREDKTVFDLDPMVLLKSY